MVRTGVDIIEVERIRRASARHGQRFYDRFFTQAEQNYCGTRQEAYAARFAAKEAVAKALGTGIGVIGWTDIEIVNDSNGMPELKLHGAAATLSEELGLVEWSISLSHTHEQAIASVVALSV